MSLRYYLFPLLFFVFCGSLAAQTGRVTESEINIQKTFIEANREKLLGNFEDAATLFREVLAEDASNGAAAYELARVYEVLDKDKEALQSIQLAVSVEPLNSWYLTYMADLHDSAKRYEEAAKVYANLIKFYPDQNYYYYKQAFYLVRAKEPGKAIKVYDQLEENIGITEDLTKKKYNLYLALDNEKKATGELKKLMKAYPSNIRYQMELAKFYESLDDREAAKKVYEGILVLDPNYGPANIALLQKKPGTQEANFLTSLKPIFSNPETDIDSKVQQLIPYIQQIAETGDQSLAQQTMSLAQILEEVHPDQAKSYSAYGDVLYYMGNKAAAKEKYKKAIQLDKSIYLLWEQLFYVMRDLKDYEGLLERTAAAQDYFPNQATVLLFRGIAFEGVEDYPAAITEYKQALLMTRRIPQLQHEILLRLGSTYTGLKKWEEAKKQYEKALALNPKDPQGLSSYAASLADSGSGLPKAFELIEEANELMPNQPEIMAIYGKVYLTDGQLDKAQNWLSKAERSGSQKYPLIYEYLGDLSQAQKNTIKAKEYWQKALELGGKKSIIEKKINAL